jgi:hypothetical protein
MKRTTTQKKITPRLREIKELMAREEAFCGHWQAW